MKNAKYYLEEIERYDKLIDSKIIEIQQLRELSMNLGSNIGNSVVQGSKTPDKTAKIIEKIVDMENEINDLIDNFIDLKKERTDVISKVVNPLYFSVLHKKYVQYLTLVDIADSEGYSYSHILEVHSKALREIGKIINSV